MTKLKLLACAAIAAFGAAACASSGGSDNQRAASASAAARTELAAEQPSAAEATSGYSDAQIASFAAASLEIDPISRTLAGATPDQQATAATEIRAILERNNLDGNTYNTIASAAQTDTALAARIAAAQVALQPAQPQSETGDAPATEPESAPTTP